MALLGFPGVGWLFAGFPVTGDDPAARRARDRLGGGPARLLALRQGPAARPRLEGRARLAAGRRALSRRRCSTARTRRGARASSARRPAAPADGAGGVPHRASASRPGRSCSCSSRCRSCRRSAGIGSSSVRYSYERGSPRRSPASSSHRRGPGDALLLERPAVAVSRTMRCAVHAARRPRLARPRRAHRPAGPYGLFDLDGGASSPLRRRARAATRSR